jgi:hypothetical protein
MEAQLSCETSLADERLSSRGRIAGHSTPNSSPTASTYPLATPSYSRHERRSIADSEADAHASTLEVAVNGRGQTVFTTFPSAQAVFWEHGRAIVIPELQIGCGSDMPYPEPRHGDRHRWQGRRTWSLRRLVLGRARVCLEERREGLTTSQRKRLGRTSFPCWTIRRSSAPT